MLGDIERTECVLSQTLITLRSMGNNPFATFFTIKKYEKISATFDFNPSMRSAICVLKESQRRVVDMLNLFYLFLLLSILN